MRRILLLALILTLAAIGTVKAQERARWEASQQWRITNPCFDNTGKWYTR